jgi:hypothetical protein
MLSLDGLKQRRYKFEIAFVLQVILVQQVTGFFLFEIQDLPGIPEDALTLIAGKEAMLFIRKENVALGFAQGTVDIRHDGFNLKSAQGIA